MGEVNVANEQNKWIDAIAKMIKLTQDGKLVWQVEKSTISAKKHPDDQIEIVYSTSYKGKNLRLYERTYKRYLPPSGIQVFLSGKSEFDWVSDVVLEFVSDTESPLWTFPKATALNDLLLSVQYQVAGVKDFLDDILREGEEGEVESKREDAAT